MEPLVRLRDVTRQGELSAMVGGKVAMRTGVGAAAEFYAAPGGQRFAFATLGKMRLRESASMV